MVVSYEYDSKKKCFRKEHFPSCFQQPGKVYRTTTLSMHAEEENRENASKVVLQYDRKHMLKVRPESHMLNYTFPNSPGTACRMCERLMVRKILQEL